MTWATVTAWILDLLADKANAFLCFRGAAAGGTDPMAVDRCRLL